jgi:hypothetical protein
MEEKTRNNHIAKPMANGGKDLVMLMILFYCLSLSLSLSVAVMMLLQKWTEGGVGALGSLCSSKSKKVKREEGGRQSASSANGKIQCAVLVRLRYREHGGRRHKRSV